MNKKNNNAKVSEQFPFSKRFIFGEKIILGFLGIILAFVLGMASFSEDPSQGMRWGLPFLFLLVALLGFRILIYVVHFNATRGNKTSRFYHVIKGMLIKTDSALIYTLLNAFYMILVLFCLGASGFFFFFDF